MIKGRANLGANEWRADLNPIGQRVSHGRARELLFVPTGVVLAIVRSRSDAD